MIGRIIVLGRDCPFKNRKSIPLYDRTVIVNAYHLFIFDRIYLKYPCELYLITEIRLTGPGSNLGSFKMKWERTEVLKSTPRAKHGVSQLRVPAGLRRIRPGRPKKRAEAAATLHALFHVHTQSSLQRTECPQGSGGQGSPFPSPSSIEPSPKSTSRAGLRADTDRERRRSHQAWPRPAMASGS